MQSMSRHFAGLLLHLPALLQSDRNTRCRRHDVHENAEIDGVSATQLAYNGYIITCPHSALKSAFRVCIEGQNAEGASFKPPSIDCTHNVSLCDGDRHKKLS